MKNSCHEHHDASGRACKSPLVRYGLIALVFLGLLAPGCGTSNYAGKAGDKDADDASQIPVEERWESALDLGNPSVTYVTTGAEPSPQPVEVENPNEPRDPISFGLSLLRNEEGLITASGSMLIEPDRSFTGHSMIFSFKNLTVDLTADTLTVSGNGVMKTTTVSGMATQAPCAASFTIRDTGNLYECDVVFAVLDLGIIRGYFSKEVLRTSVTELSFVSNTWAKKGPGVTVHFPRKRYTDQAVLSGQVQDAILNFQVSASEADPRVTGALDIPSTLSVNKDRLRIDLNNVPAYIHDAEHTFRFHQSGTLTTLDAQGNSIQSDYSLSVTVSAENITVYSPNPDYDPDNPLAEAMDLATGKRTQYTVRMTLVLDGIETRTTVITEIRRTDVPDLVVGTGDPLPIPTMLGGTFALEGGKTYSLTHAFSRGMTEDTVETDISAVQFNLALTQAGERVLGEGRLALSNDATPDTVPALIVDFENLNVIVSEGALRIEAPVRLEREHSVSYSTFVDASLNLSITKQPGGDYLMELAVRSNDYETNISFSTKVLKTDEGLSFTDSAWALSPGSNHGVSVTTGDEPAVSLDIPDSDLAMSLILGRRVDQGLLSTKASGSIRLVHSQFNGGLAFQAVFSDAPILVDDDGSTLHMAGLWSLQGGPANADLSGNTLSITFYETETGDRMFQVTLTVPGDGIVPPRTVEFILPAEKTAGSIDLLAELLT